LFVVLAFISFYCLKILVEFGVTIFALNAIELH
jgi:hypothetical protein